MLSAFQTCGIHRHFFGQCHISPHYDGVVCTFYSNPPPTSGSTIPSQQPLWSPVARCQSIPPDYFLRHSPASLDRVSFYSFSSFHFIPFQRKDYPSQRTTSCRQVPYTEQTPRRRRFTQRLSTILRTCRCFRSSIRQSRAHINSLLDCKFPHYTAPTQPRYSLLILTYNQVYQQ